MLVYMYRQKYLKYKSKYINLKMNSKNQIGGRGDVPDRFCTVEENGEFVCIPGHDLDKSKCQPKKWGELILTNSFSNKIVWTIKGSFTPDQMLGLAVAGLMILTLKNLHIQNYFTVVEANDKSRYLLGNLLALNVLGVSGGYLEVSHICTNCTGDHKADDGTTGIWILDYGSGNKSIRSYWNLFQTDNIDEFMQGFEAMCKIFDLNYRDYILGVPMESEGIPIDDFFDNLKIKKLDYELIKG